MNKPQNPKTLYKVVLNANTAFTGTLDECCAYVKRLYGEDIAVKKILDDGILIKPAERDNMAYLTTTLKNGVTVLAKDDGSAKTYANKTQAEGAVALIGGAVYQSPQSRVFFVKIEERAN